MEIVEKNKRILVADDDSTILDIAEYALSQAGYDVYVATSGEQAIEIASTNEIDLALLDYRMPNLSGLEAGKAIYNFTGVRFIIMSMHTDQAIMEQASKDGALSFLVKPLEVNDILAQVQVGLGRASEFKTLESSLKQLEAEHNTAISRATASARSVNTAIGILMERLQKPRDEVYQLLVRRARDERKRLVEISEKIVQARETDYQWKIKEPGESSRSK